MLETIDTETVNIVVPARFASQLERFVALLAIDPSASKVLQRAIGDATVSQSERPDYPLWEDADVISLANAGTKTAANYRAIMDAVIREDNVGEWVSISQLAHWTGIEFADIKAFRTHLYRYINAHYTGVYSTAPFTGAWGADLSPSRGRVVYYRVSRECAYQWERIQDALS